MVIQRFFSTTQAVFNELLNFFHRASIFSRLCEYVYGKYEEPEKKIINGFYYCFKNPGFIKHSEIFFAAFPFSFAFSYILLIPPFIAPNLFSSIPLIFQGIYLLLGFILLHVLYSLRTYKNYGSIRKINPSKDNKHIDIFVVNNFKLRLRTIKAPYFSFYVIMALNIKVFFIWYFAVLH